MSVLPTTLPSVLTVSGPDYFRALSASAKRRAALCPELASEALLVAEDYEQRAARLEAACQS